MGRHNTYLDYKRDQRCLLAWLVDAHNSIVRRTSQGELKTTGGMTVKELLSTTTQIATHAGTSLLKAVPDIVHRLLRLTIKGRSAVAKEFEKMEAVYADSELSESNASHQAYISALEKAFCILGGEAWMVGKQNTSTVDHDENEIRLELLANRFSILGVQDDALDEGTDTVNDDGQANPRQYHRKAHRRKGKGSKDTSKQQKDHACEDNQLDIPWESYRIIEGAKTAEDGHHLVTDYLLAAHGLVQQWIDIRAYLQALWQEAAYDGLNTAVAAAVSKVALNMIKNTEAAVFVEFPGHDDYETVMHTITKGDPDNLKNVPLAGIYRLASDESVGERTSESPLDIREVWLINTYDHLLDFLFDFQKNRTGKPTKAMAAQLGTWDPTVDLKSMSKEERLAWRRTFTINWLYDLVNVYASTVTERIAFKGEKYDMATIDWSASGPWIRDRRLFGLNDFAGTVTRLAFQKPCGKGAVDIRRKILPHTVFELQCILDSMCVARGWSISATKGHILEAPSSDQFQSLKDVDQFLDRENNRTFQGSKESLQNLGALYTLDHGLIESDPRGFMSRISFGLAGEFSSWLGQSSAMSASDSILTSRFSNTNANGLHHYSPYLCGAGLVEALELAYRFGLMVWDESIEPFLLIHLHHMLVKKGYIEEPINLFETLQDIFPKGFFGTELLNEDSELNQGHFYNAIINHLNNLKSAKVLKQQQRDATHANDYNGLWNIKKNRVFYDEKSFVATLRDAEWDLERVPDRDLVVPEFYAGLKADNQERTSAVAAKNVVLQRWQLLAPDLELKDIFMRWSVFFMHRETPLLADVGADLRPDETMSSREPLPKGRHGSKPTMQNDLLTDRNILEAVKLDVRADICGNAMGFTLPRSSIDFARITHTCVTIWRSIEERLEKQHKNFYRRVYVPEQQHPRVQVTVQALRYQDDRILRMMAEQFEKFRIEFCVHTYWDVLEDMATTMGKGARNSDKNGLPDPCRVM